MKPIVPGTCCVCACTDLAPCPERCSWTNEQHTLCSSCLGNASMVLTLLEFVMKLEIRMSVDTLETLSGLFSQCQEVLARNQPFLPPSTLVQL
jgi:hypothetical protein